MVKQITQKSFIFLLLVLAVAAVAFYLVWNDIQQELPAGQTSNQKISKPVIESADITALDSELDQELKAFDRDAADITNLGNDPTLNNINTQL
ncbi:MAG: hypothetical protein AUJ32_03115 [Parcubacteria group bacterium CG1_02_40_82]|uniref:Uncharacterized protein n=4 Tax=Candidatus Portnoyibacteriota TaxID=1817913 RepID=A0A2M7IHM3_9BACT|nr:MAG: hypothetical protein AUJ32_03115 [Parcubacteria group bacterium CG1_02_40_82]PIQ75444.1 MAG: hypothetical protein COV84_01255 [Candidatus Portnoybacteria bacterium CG11_big_fil_rev_8_21_14_0_20_40_15]PIS30051.1 MAG: hypothetical protein COT41_03820 [Candidatus Portnoybacteria bacterium CG08_land_8_20_14_0_20_40_83]PIW76030.1 MAG: hypothetical protein CO001_03530 [Candidatus Portnoybacteria bacterium CG_4_8_14_3_um_filter_40_10]PIY75006.1 MAG: hypothetical protein COY85_01570 [Candidatus